MVFESIVVDILNKFLGAYVQNLDSSQLKLGIWGGDVVLQNLLLKENALDDLNLPVKCISGQLSKLTMKIPWKNIYVAPVVVHIQGLDVLCVPNRGVAYDAEKEEKMAWDTKQQQLKKLEEAKRVEEERKKPRNPEQDTFTEKLIAQIIRNVQVKIQDIHLRYEDELCNPGSPFAFGLTLHNLFFETTTESWKVGSASETTKMIYKMVTLSSLAVYWNPKSRKLFRNMSEKERAAAFKNGIAIKGYKPHKVQYDENTAGNDVHGQVEEGEDGCQRDTSDSKYILGPINSTIKLQMNQKPETDKPEFSISKIKLIIMMDELYIGITKYQYQDILILSQSLEWMATSATYRKYRPNVPHKGHAKEWWKFAYKCVLEEDVKRRRRNWSWRHIRHHRKSLRKYKEAYRLKLMGKKTSSDDLLVDLEKEIDFFNLALVRKQADMEFARSGLGKATEKKQTGWFGGWFAEKKDKKEEASIVKQFEAAMTPEEKAKLREAIGYQENVVPAVYPKHFIENKLKFELKKLVITVIDDSRSNAAEVTHLLLENVFSTVDQRPAAQAIKIITALDKLTVTGLRTSGHGKPLLVTTQYVQHKSSKSVLLDMLFETNPLDEKCDYRLHLFARPLEIVYNADTINELAQVFKPPKSVELYSKFKAAASNTLAGIKEASAMSMQYALEHHKHLELNLDVKAPYVIVPEKGFLKSSANTLIVDMGNLKMTSQSQKYSSKSLVQLSKSGASREEFMKEVMQQAYEQYKISLLGIQILFATPGDDWKAARIKSSTNLHLWCPTNLEVLLDKCVVLDDPRLPKIKIKGELPSIQLTLSDKKLLQLAKLLVGIPFPESETTEEETTALPEAPRSRKTSLTVVPQAKIPAIRQEAPSLASDVQVTNVEMVFEIGRIGFTMVKVRENVNTDLLNFRIHQMGISLKNQTYETKVDMYIGDITLENKEFKTSDGQPMYIIQTPKAGRSATKLLSCSYLAVNKKSPTFKTTHQRTQQLVKANFSVLRLFLHQEALLSLVEFANNLQAELDVVMKAQATPRPRAHSKGRRSRQSSGAASTKASATTLAAIAQRKSRHVSGDEVINMKVLAKLDAVTVNICSKEKNIVDVSVGGLEADVTLQKSRTTLNCILKTTEVCNPKPKALHRQIVSVVGQEMINLKIVTYNFATKGDGYLNMSKVDTSVKATISGIRIVFLNKFVTEAMGFLNNFQAAMARVKEATAKVAEAAMENVQSVYQKASRISLNISMKAPVIIMPRNSKAIEVLLLDMGRIAVNNSFRLGKISENGDQTPPPIMEQMQLKLQNFKMSRALLNSKATSEVAECHLFDPMTVSFTVIRNLSAGWCKEIPEIEITGSFGAVGVTMSQEDFNIVMHIISDNLGEEAGVVEPESVPPSGPPSSKPSSSNVKKLAPIVEKPKSPTTGLLFPRYKFNFTLDQVSANLYFGKTDLKEGLVVRPAERALAKFELHVIAVKGEMLTDDSIWANLVLVNIILDDMRENSTYCIKRLMERNVLCKTENMIDVTFRKDAQKNVFTDVRISSFNLVACPDYLMTVSEFFTKDVSQSAEPELGSAVPEKTVEKPKTAYVTPPPEAEPEPPSEGTFTLNLNLEQPDIILVENMSELNTEAIILNHFITARIKKTPDYLNFMAVVSNLQILSCIFNPEMREDTKAEILSPCEINVSGNTPASEGMRLDVDISDIELHMAPGSVRLLSSISSMFRPIPPATEEDSKKEVDYSDLWSVKPLDAFTFWFLKPEVAQDALMLTEMTARTNLTEQIILKAKTIIMTVEIGIGNQTVPMLLAEAGFFADVRNWSTQLEVHGGITLEMLCYNEKLALWEPFIERVETPKGARPWELAIELQTHGEYPSESMIAASPTDSEEEIIFEPPKMAIAVVSPDNLDICITKTDLEVLSNLGQAFSDAVNLVPASAKKDQPKCPFLVKNNTGMPVTLVLKHEDFAGQGWEWILLLSSDLQEYSYLVTGKTAEGISEVVLEAGTSVELKVKVDPTVASKKSVLKMQDFTSDRKLLVKVDNMKAVRQISVKKADKRFFPLPQQTYPGDHWGIVSDIKALYGCKIITLRSVLQVKNFFMVPIEVYYMSSDKDEVVCCGVVEPGSNLDVPVAAVYTNTNEIFFRPKDNNFSVSSTSFVWKDLIKNPTFHKRVVCSPRKKEGKNFLINVLGEIDQVFLEETKRKTLASTCYILNLKPSVVVKNMLPLTLQCSDQNGSEVVDVEKGQSVELVWVEVNSSSIMLKIPNYLDQTWVCTKKVETSVAELTVWSFETSPSQAPHNIMDLGVYMEDDYEAVALTLYCPFWMINKTSCTLTYKAEDIVTAVAHAPTYEGPILFSFKAKNFFSRKKAGLKIEDSEWSDKFSIDVVGSSGTVKCRKNSIVYEVGVQIKLASFQLSKIVMFTPYFMVVNKCSYDIMFQETGPGCSWIEAPPGECLPFWPTLAKQHELKVKTKDLPEESKAFEYADPHTTLLRLNNKYGGIQVDVQVTESSIITTFSEYQDGKATVRLVNALSHTAITYNQSGEKSIYNLGPNETVLYTWDSPDEKRELHWMSSEKKEFKVDLVKDGIGEFRPEEEEIAFWVSFLDDTQRILLFTDDLSVATRAQCAGELERVDQEITIALQGFGLSLVDNVNRIEVLYVSIASSGMVWEACKEKSRRFKPLPINQGTIIENAYQNYLNAQRTGLAVSSRQSLEGKLEVDFQLNMMYKPQKRKINRSFQTGLWISYKTSSHRTQLHAKINRFQIDNQMPDCIFRVILAPVPPPKTVAADSAPKPFTEVSIMMRKSDYSTVQQYKYFKVLVQEFHIKIDQAFIGGTLTMFSHEDATTDDASLFQTDLKCLETTLKDLAETQAGQEQQNFYDLLHFSPLKVHVSFSNQGCASSSDNKKSAQLGSNAMNLFVQSVGVTLTEIQDVVFKLGYFERSHRFISQKQLINEAVTHYSGQAIKQMYVLVLGLDVIGNPFGLVVGLTHGVEDLFYEPFQGAIQGPEEFAEGLALGVKSLFGHAVGGAAGAVSRITGTLGKGVAALTMDEDYQRKRREAQLRRTGNIQEGLAQSGKGLVMGVFDGVTGVFTKPVEGAKEEGVEGFFKGVGKGVIGLVTRPTAGVIDFASGTLDSVKRVAESSSETNRFRPARFFKADGVVRPYNRHEAEGYRLLQEVEKGKFSSTDSYVGHVTVSTCGKFIVLITDKRIIMVSKGDIFGQWSADWQVVWDEMVPGPAVWTDKGVSITLKEAKKKKLGLFGGGENNRVIQLKNQEIGEWIIEKIEEAKTEEE